METILYKFGMDTYIIQKIFILVHNMYMKEVIREIKEYKRIVLTEQLYKYISRERNIYISNKRRHNNDLMRYCINKVNSFILQNELDVYRHCYFITEDDVYIMLQHDTEHFRIKK